MQRQNVINFTKLKLLLLWYLLMLLDVQNRQNVMSFNQIFTKEITCRATGDRTEENWTREPANKNQGCQLLDCDRSQAFFFFSDSSVKFKL